MACDLFRYSVRLGAQGLAHGGGSEAWWRVWMPLDIDRVVELPWAAGRVIDAHPKRVLDLAGPKLLACWLAEHTDSEILATDVWETEIARWRKLVNAVDPQRRRFARLALEPADGTALPYTNDSFDAVVSVSVIEHIPDEGDVAAMRELARVLRAGGRLVLTFPYGVAAKDVYVEQDLYGKRYQGEPLFFYRRYSPDTVQSRLFSTGQFELVDRIYWEKHSIQSAQSQLHRLTPSRWEPGRVLGPLLSVIGSRALRPGCPEQPGADGVLGLVLHRLDANGL
jgi:SAM-dependent methyltransferase